MMLAYFLLPFVDIYRVFDLPSDLFWPAVGTGWGCRTVKVGLFFDLVGQTIFFGSKELSEFDLV